MAEFVQVYDGGVLVDEFVVEETRYVLHGVVHDWGGTSLSNKRAFLSIDWKRIGRLFRGDGSVIPVLDYASAGATGVTGPTKRENGP